MKASQKYWDIVFPTFNSTSSGSVVRTVSPIIALLVRRKGYRNLALCFQ